MAKATQAASIVTSATESKLITIGSLSEFYDAVHELDKQFGKEKQFLEKFGAKKQFMGQFKRQPYDGGA